jgi:hypothetical protein
MPIELAPCHALSVPLMLASPRQPALFLREWRAVQLALRKILTNFD